MPHLIAASVAGADQAALGSAVAGMSRHVDIIHIDVEDGVFSPCLTLGPAAVRDLRPRSSLPFEVHLMVQRPEDMIRQVAAAGADSIIVNVEACPYPLRVVRLVRSLGKKAGLAFNWGTPLQRYFPRAPERVGEARLALANLADLPAGPRLIADGGLNDSNVAVLRDRGAGEFVVGRYLWQGKDVATQVSKLRAALGRT